MAFASISKEAFSIMFDILQLNDMLVPELRELAERLGIQGYRKLNKKELVYKILDYQALAEGSERPAFEPGSPAGNNSKMSCTARMTTKFSFPIQPPLTTQLRNSHP
jgi:hypothetical protein